MNTNSKTEGKMQSKTGKQRGKEQRKFRFKIWQIESCEANIPYLFTDSEFLVNHESTVFPPPKGIYREVYSASQKHFGTEDVFARFNRDLPKDYRARSLSMSDVLEYELPKGKKLYLYCDRYWFVAVDFRPKYQIARLPEYSPGSKTDEEQITLFYKDGESERTVTAISANLFNGNYTGMTQDGNTVHLKPAEIYNATLFILNGRSRYRKDNTPKTLVSWLNCGIPDLFDYVYPGDEVEKELIDHFIKDMKGTYKSNDYIQAGEALAVRYDNPFSVWPAYHTFALNVNGKWCYVGVCREKDKQNISPFLTFPQRIEKMLF